ncbi:MAG: hypothetical protein ACHQM6_05875, partial [Candidatus Kapaibacterium sp.]
MFACIFAFPTLGRSQPLTNAGTDFMLIFMQNDEANYDVSSSALLDIFLLSTGDSATVTITCKGNLSFNQVIHLDSNGSFVYRPGNGGTMNTNQVIDSTVFHITSTTPIICYGFSNKAFTADGFLALPRSNETTEYRILSYPNSTLVGQEKPSEFAFASFDDNNTVTITPTSQTRNGSPRGTPFQFILNVGEGVQIQTLPTTPGSDLTGSIVKSTKPIAVYSGHSRTEVPSGYIYPDGGGATSRDHIADAMPPVSTWGRFFVAKNTNRPTGDLVRILVSKDNTIIKINGIVWGPPLNGGEFRDTIIMKAIAIETSHPALVGLIGHSAASESVLTGDPFLAIIPPLEQSLNDSRYFIPSETGFDPFQQFLIVVTEQTGKGKIAIDGSLIPSSVFADLATPLNGKNYSVATISQTAGAHHITSSNTSDNGFTAIVFGFGDVIGYGYSAGTGLKPLFDNAVAISGMAPFATLENFPNPVMGKTTITFNIPARAYASVKIYDALGRVVRVVSQGMESEGVHSIEI